MCPPDTDPWSSRVAPDPDPTKPTTRDAAAAPRRRGTGTDPGLGDVAPAPAPDTVVDGADTDPPRVEDPTWAEADAPTTGGLEAQLDEFAGRPPQLAHVQSDSAGLYAARFATVMKPARSRAVAHTAPPGVIVALDSTPRGQTAHAPGAVTARMRAAPVSPADAAAEITQPDLPTLVEHARGRKAAEVSTFAGARARGTRPSRSRALYAALLLLVITGTLLAVFFLQREPNGGDGPPASTPGVPAVTAPAASTTPPAPSPSARETPPAVTTALPSPASRPSAWPVPSPGITAKSAATIAPGPANARPAPPAPRASSTDPIKPPALRPAHETPNQVF